MFILIRIRLLSKPQIELIGSQNKKGPSPFLSGDPALFILISPENSSHQRHPFPLRHLSFLGLIFFILFNSNQSKSQQNTYLVREIKNPAPFLRNKVFMRNYSLLSVTRGLYVPINFYSD